MAKVIGNLSFSSFLPLLNEVANQDVWNWKKEKEIFCDDYKLDFDFDFGYDSDFDVDGFERCDYCY
jgi:hypothetical protein